MLRKSENTVVGSVTPVLSIDMGEMAERSKALVSGFLSKLLVRNGVGSNPTLVRDAGSIPVPPSFLHLLV